MKLHQFLTKDNWVNHGGNRKNTYCILDAIDYCYINIEEWRNARSAIQIALNFEHAGEIVRWNDDPERTFEQVQAVLLKLDI